MDDNTKESIRYAVFLLAVVLAAFLKLDLTALLVGLAGGVAIPVSKTVAKVLKNDKD